MIQGVDPHQYTEKQAMKAAEKPKFKLAEIIDIYLQHCSISNRPKTLEIKKYAFQIFKEYLGDCYFDSITQEMIEQWMTDINLSKTSVNMYLRAVRSMFNWAFEQEMIPKNPFGNGRIKQFKVPQSDPEGYFTVEEVAVILETVKKMDLELWRLVFLALETGGRISELLTLQGEDLDLEEGRILFRGKSTKSGKNRYVPFRHKAVQ